MTFTFCEVAPAEPSAEIYMFKEEFNSTDEARTYAEQEADLINILGGDPLTLEIIDENGKRVGVVTTQEKGNDEVLV